MCIIKNKIMKIAIITGSSKGIGRAIAIRLAKDSYISIVTFNTDEEGAIETLKQVKNVGDGMKIKLDVTKEESVKIVFDIIKKEFGKLDVLTNNAGIERPNTIEECSLQDWNDVVQTKINGNFLCTKYAIPLLKEAKISHIFNIVSNLGERPDPDYPAYCVGTAGTIAFTKMMAIHLGKYGIRVNGIAPGTTRTPMWDVMGGDNNKMWDSFAKNNPLGRVSTPEDIANTIALLLAKEAEYLNGNIVYVNGGSHLK